jgi:hypothetical protein
MKKIIVVCILIASASLLFSCGKETAKTIETTSKRSEFATSNFTGEGATPEGTTDVKIAQIERSISTQWRQLLVEKPIFEKLKDKYNLAIEVESEDFLYAKCKLNPHDEFPSDADFVFQKNDSLDAFCLVSISAPTYILLPEYVDVLFEKLPLTVIKEKDSDALYMRDEQFDYFVSSSNNVYLAAIPQIKVRLIQQPSLLGEYFPNQSYLGTWHAPEGDLKILDISSGTIAFEMHIYRKIGITAIARIENSKIRFFCGDQQIKGTFEFEENSILATIDESTFPGIEIGTNYSFKREEQSFS